MCIDFAANLCKNLAREAPTQNMQFPWFKLAKIVSEKFYILCENRAFSCVLCQALLLTSLWMQGQDAGQGRHVFSQENTSQKDTAPLTWGPWQFVGFSHSSLRERLQLLLDSPCYLNKPQKGDVCISLVETKCGKILPSWITDANCSPSSCFSWKAFGSYLLFPGNFLKPWFSSYAVRAPRMGGGRGQPPRPSRAALVWSVFLIFLT